MLKLPVRILIIIIIIVLFGSFPKNKLTDFEIQSKANYFDQSGTGIPEPYKDEVRIYLASFLNKLEEGNLKDAYAMIDEACKVDDFKTQADFEKYIERYVVDKDKWGKSITYRADIERGEENGNMIYSYEITVVPDDFNTVVGNPYEEASKSEQKEYFPTKKFYLNVVQSGIYQYKIQLFSKSIS